ncbi:MAG: RrF2 family transcriptional regulator [Brevundimonas sp.]
MISNKARYALRSLIFLAERHPQPASIAEIAVGAKAPRKFLETILLELKLDGVLESRRGRMGGYELARPASEITVADILRSIDGPLALAPCASRTSFKPCEDCADIDNCRIRHILLEGRDALAAILEARKLSDLTKVSGALEELT